MEPADDVVDRLHHRTRRIDDADPGVFARQFRPRQQVLHLGHAVARRLEVNLAAAAGQVPIGQHRDAGAAQLPPWVTGGRAVAHVPGDMRGHPRRRPADQLGRPGVAAAVPQEAGVGDLDDVGAAAGQPPELGVERVGQVGAEPADVAVVLIDAPERQGRGAGIDVDLDRPARRPLERPEHITEERLRPADLLADDRLRLADGRLRPVP